MRKLPIEFKKCPICGHTETVTRLAIEEFKQSGKVKKDAFASARKDAIPLTEPTMAIATVPTLLRHFDTCAECGIEYCTKAERIETPIQFQAMAQGVQRAPGR